jgi:signal transduction histidine kinase
MPVELEREVYVLAVHVDPRAFLALLTPQRLRGGWVGVVLDANKHIVARTVNNDGFLGQPASDSLRMAIDRGVEGWFAGRLIEDTRVYTSFKQSPATNWTVAIGIPAMEVEEIGRDTIQVLMIGLLVAVTIALALAAYVSRKISGPMQSLAVAAKALGKGGALPVPVDAVVSEVRDVSRALVSSAQAVSEREEKLRAADTAKDEFLAMLGHELRNPLGALTSAAQVLSDCPGVQ